MVLESATSRPSVVVAANDRFLMRSSGIKKVAVHPAPSIRSLCSFVMSGMSGRKEEQE